MPTSCCQLGPRAVVTAKVANDASWLVLHDGPVSSRRAALCGSSHRARTRSRWEQAVSTPHLVGGLVVFNNYREVVTNTLRGRAATKIQRVRSRFCRVRCETRDKPERRGIA